MIINELRRPRPGSPRREIEFYSPKFTKALHDRVGQTWLVPWLAYGVHQNRAYLGLHGPAMPRGPDAKPLQYPIVEIPYAHRRHTDHLHCCYQC